MLYRWHGFYECISGLDAPKSIQPHRWINFNYYSGLMVKRILLNKNYNWRRKRVHDIRIKTGRLLLRPLMEEDADSIFEWVSDERVARYMVYTTYTDIEQVREWLAFISQNTSTYNFGFERLSDGLLIGSGDIGQGKKPGWWGFGYNFRYDCWGMGYATEAVKAMIDYTYENFGARKFASSHCEPNIASGNVMKKCGLHFTGYGEFQKLDGSCKMRSMEYEGYFK